MVDDIQNPYRANHSFDKRFAFTLNKIYAWRLTEYQRVVMLDVDNLFLRKPDELFQCGQFCAVFINPCIFHTGLFVLQASYYSESSSLSECFSCLQLVVCPLTNSYTILCAFLCSRCWHNLQPSNETFGMMMHDIKNMKANRDGVDQGFLGSHFSDLLDQPMFHPPVDGSRLNGLFRLPLGYQMDASFFCKYLCHKILEVGGNYRVSVCNFASFFLLEIHHSCLGAVLIKLFGSERTHRSSTSSGF